MQMVRNARSGSI